MLYAIRDLTCTVCDNQHRKARRGSARSRLCSYVSEVSYSKYVQGLSDQPGSLYRIPAPQGDAHKSFEHCYENLQLMLSANNNIQEDDAQPADWIYLGDDLNNWQQAQVRKIRNYLGYL